MNVYFSMSAYISLYCGNTVEQMLGYHALKADNVLQKNVDLETEDTISSLWRAATFLGIPVTSKQFKFRPSHSFMKHNLIWVRVAQR